MSKQNNLKLYNTCPNSIKKLIDELYKYIVYLANKKNIKVIESVQSVIKGGRRYSYDFEILINNIQFKVEFKFNATELTDPPQFSSPSKPDEYLDCSYDEMFYKDYLSKITGEDKKPAKEIYLKYVHNNKPVPGMEQFKEKYSCGSIRSKKKYTGKQEDIDFYNLCNKISQDSIRHHISNTNLKIEKLSQYLQETQRDKYYMLYDKVSGTFNCRTMDMNILQIASYIKDPNGYRYIATTKSGRKLNILLRWKNGNGIAYPAFQIRLVKDR